MRKTDFQLEEELSGSLRQLKPQGQDDLLREHFDTRFRLGQVELDAPTKSEKKRSVKAQFKFKERRGGVYGTLAEKLQKKNEKARKDYEEKKNKSGFLNQDLILIWICQTLF